MHRYVFRELMLIFSVATVGLAALMGIKEVLSALERYGLAPSESLKFLLLSMPTTFFVAVPIGAVLAATLVYGRLAADNEINACRASGIHLGTLIWPGIFFGLLMGTMNLALYAWPIPASYYGTKVIARRDIERIFFEQLRSRGHVGYGGYELAVDRVEGDTLYGVLVSFRRRNEPRWYGVAPYAMVTFDKESNHVRLILKSAETWQEAGSSRGRGDQVLGFDIPTDIPR
ncbi:MAG: LptF/LptG family permease, partial [Phycisphaerae bacterium]|nr:LptF/LptG family permease [Phycisphaerae bacterium]